MANSTFASLAGLSRARRLIIWLAVFGVLLTACVVALGAWTRLSDAGLGCPDWPTCYGMLTVPTQAHDVARANELYPGQPVEAHKAWPETIHRYFASTIGLVITLIAGLALYARRETGVPVKHAVFLFFLVCLQGAFGAWTVTMKLFPPVVTGHLLFGFATFTTLFLLALRVTDVFPATGNLRARSLLPLTVAALVIVALQIALGGWTASNYAATMCTTLPVCQDGWTQVLNFPDAFEFHTYAGTTYEFAPHLGPDAKITIHVTHRIGAMVATLAVGLLSFLLWQRLQAPRYRAFAGVLLLVLLLQLALGVSNIVFHLPLAVAVAHNFVALVLLEVLVALLFSLAQEGRQKGRQEGKQA